MAKEAYTELTITILMQL